MESQPEMFTGGAGLSDFPNVFLTRADAEPAINVHGRSRLVRFSKCFSDKGEWRAARNVHGRSRLVRFSKCFFDKGGWRASQKCSRAEQACQIFQMFF